MTIAMSRYRDDRDDSVNYPTRRAGRRSYAEERFNNDAPRADQNQRPDDYAGDYVNERNRSNTLPYGGDRDDYGRGGSGYGGAGNRADYGGATGRDSYGGYDRDDYGRMRYEGGREGVGRDYQGRGAQRSHVRCRDIMTRDVTVATRDTTLQQVAVLMRDEDTGVIPVVEPLGATAGVGGQADASPRADEDSRRAGANAAGNGKLVGLITDRDIVVRAIAEGKNADATRAEEIMTSDVHTAQPNDRVIDAIRKMGDKQVRRIPVVDRDGNLRGIISMADVALETEADRELADALEEISSGSSFWSKMFG